MLKIKLTDIYGFPPAIRGMRNPKNSWDKSDSVFIEDGDLYDIMGNMAPWEDIDYDKSQETGIGPNDYNLMNTLRNAGTDHRKFMRMIVVYADITAPLYWWKEYDTYKVGTVANSCSTMHKIHAKKFTLDDFSCEHLGNILDFSDLNMKAPMIDASPFNDEVTTYTGPKNILELTISMLNECRKLYLETKDKRYWWQMIQLLPTSYNQKRTIMLNYEVLANIYKSRKNHKLDEWHTFCDWIKSLPYSELITGEFDETKEEN